MIPSAASSITVVIAVYNAEASLTELCRRLGEVLPAIATRYEMILVNDCSRDRSWDVISALAASSLAVRGINLMRNYGQHNALLCGIRAANCDLIVTMDDDLQHSPEEIPRLLARLDEGFDVVYGAPNAEQNGLMRALASRITGLALRTAIGNEVAKNVSAFRVFRTQLREAFAGYQSPFVSIDVLLTWATTRFSVITVAFQPRHSGSSNYTFGKLVRHALDMMTGFSTAPLQLASLTFVLRGARPVFVDIRADTLNIDENQIEQRITGRTKAIFLVHYAGVGCEMDTILAIARRHAIVVVEDNAHGLYGRYRGRYLGTFGQLAALSFHETKNFSCGEGGALLINDTRFNQRAEILREKGTDRSRFFRGEIDKYNWVDVGSSYLPSDLLAAFLRAQLEHRDRIQSMRRKVWENYARELASWAETNGARLPIVPPECQQSYHMFYLIMPSSRSRQALISHLAGLEILAVFHYLPLHLSPMGLRFGGSKGDCPVTEEIAERLLRLPFYTGMTKSEQVQVIEAVSTFRC
jgi:dTDP-4-amino-4,6-dideoxygalactose transaminase